MMKENIGNTGVVSSKEQLVANKFIAKFIETGKAKDLEFTDIPENIEKIKDFIVNLGARLVPGEFSYDDVINELKKSGVIKPAPVLEKVKEPKEIKIHETQFVELKGFTTLEVDEEQTRILESNLFLEEIHRANIFVNKAELKNIYKKAVSLETKKTSEDPEYYYAFAKAGLIKSQESKTPEQVVADDLESLRQRKEEFQHKEDEDPRIPEAKEIAKITEYGLAYAVSNLHWWGERISIESASEFDDVKRGVDDFMEIRNKEDESSFLGLGIDVTYRGLKSEQFKHKFFKNLQSIYDGYKTKVKYCKNHQGKMMEEFAVPKIILYFDVEGVRELSNIVKHAGEPDEMEKLKNSPQKYSVLNQIVNSCTILSDFAEECKNNIFRGYNKTLNSLKELSWENDVVKQVISESTIDNEISKHLKSLIEEFKEIKKQEHIVATSE